MDVNSFIVGYTKGKQSASGGGGGGSSGGVELNIAYGDTPPEDTTKLWVKTSEPKEVMIKPNAEAFQYADELAKTNALYGHAGAISYGCCVTVGDGVYVMGGGSSASSMNSYFDKIYTNGAYWYRTQILRNFTSPTFNACCATDGSLIYFFGGHVKSGQWVTLDSIKVVDPIAKTQSTASVTLPNRTTRACCASVGTKTYIFGGNTSISNTNIIDTILCFDHETVTIGTIATKLPVAIQSMCCSAVGTKIYIFGGVGVGTGILNTVYCFDTETEKIELLDVPMPVPLAFSTCSPVGENIYIFGGVTGANLESSYDIYRFNTQRRKFYKCESTLSNGAVGACAATLGEQILLFLGCEYTSTLPCITNAIKEIDSFVGSVDFSLEEENLQIVTNESSNIFPVVKGQGMQIDIGVSSIFKGSQEGIGEPVEAAIYKDGEWVTI